MGRKKKINMELTQKIGFGGGCHWCTEAVFQYLKGVEKVEQGWIASELENDTFSEAVIVHFNPNLISLSILVEIHLHTHKSTSMHSMRKKYRSAVYIFTELQQSIVATILHRFQPEFEGKIITQVLPYKAFKTSSKDIQLYYHNNPHKPFCEQYIAPKLAMLFAQFSTHIKPASLVHLQSNKIDEKG